MTTEALIGLIIGLIILLAFVIIIIYIYKKCSKKEITKKIGDTVTDDLKYSKFTINITETNEKKKIIFITTAQKTTEILVEINQTMEQVRQLYLNKVQKPNLFFDKNIVFIYKAEIFTLDSKIIVGTLFGQNEKVIKVMVTDLENKIT